MRKRKSKMNTNLTIKNDKISNYLNTEDSIIGLKKAVENGQTRLALEVVVDVVTEIFERLLDLEEKVNTIIIDSNEINKSVPDSNSLTDKIKENSIKENIEKK